MAELITKQQRPEDTLATNTFEDWDKYTLLFGKIRIIIWIAIFSFSKKKATKE